MPCECIRENTKKCDSTTGSCDCEDSWQGGNCASKIPAGIYLVPLSGCKIDKQPKEVLELQFSLMWNFWSNFFINNHLPKRKLKIVTLACSPKEILCATVNTTHFQWTVLGLYGKIGQSALNYVVMRIIAVRGDLSLGMKKDSPATNCKKKNPQPMNKDANAISWAVQTVSWKTPWVE